MKKTKKDKMNLEKIMLNWWENTHKDDVIMQMMEHPIYTYYQNEIHGADIGEVGKIYVCTNNDIEFEFENGDDYNTAEMSKEQVIEALVDFFTQYIKTEAKNE